MRNPWGVQKWIQCLEVFSCANPSNFDEIRKYILAIAMVVYEKKVFEAKINKEYI